MNKDNKKQSAIELLEEALGKGSVSSKSLIALAGERDISERTLKDAKKTLGIEAYKDGSVWMWHYSSVQNQSSVQDSSVQNSQKSSVQKKDAKSSVQKPMIGKSKGLRPKAYLKSMSKRYPNINWEERAVSNPFGIPVTYNVLSLDDQRKQETKEILEAELAVTTNKGGKEVLLYSNEVQANARVLWHKGTHPAWYCIAKAQRATHKPSAYFAKLMGDKAITRLGFKAA